MILVLGETGSGKSTFINTAKPNGKMAFVGHSLESCTTTPERYLIDDGERRVFLVDTPGFNDSNTATRDDDILNIIIKWLQDALERDKNARLAGMIYLHDITNTESRVPKLVDANKLQIPPSVLLVTVQCHAGTIPDQKILEFRQRYPIFSGDHFGYRDQQSTALAIIDKVIESRSVAPLSSVIEKLQQLVNNSDRPTAKSRKPSFWKVIRELFSSFKTK